ncbi:Heat-labile enterotoxin IIB, A chain [Ophiocordyceps camponoti-floridani]|uniref:Heat-labile enterotoxin IIB, A chain n=1 Tax=Ophiocordyceps camponoti-floridani TaxID=2030778 RepID=A0A8H4Q5R8_9HYPO|nr:Heat-labile enterotoxin IIB, A chain [Ophiocordyceps camponoti-floridani]
MYWLTSPPSPPPPPNNRHPLLQRRRPPPAKKQSLDDDIVFLFRGEEAQRRSPHHVRLRGGFEPALPGYVNFDTAFQMGHHMDGGGLEELWGSEILGQGSDDVFLDAFEGPTDSVEWGGSVGTIYASPEGFIYIIHPTPNMIDPSNNEFLSNLATANREICALGGIQFSQVYGWISYSEYLAIEEAVEARTGGISVETDSLFQRELVSEVLQRAQRNEAYDVGWFRYGVTRGVSEDLRGIDDAVAFMDAQGVQG